jgi:hypothetical protein
VVLIDVRIVSCRVVSCRVASPPPPALLSSACFIGGFFPSRRRRNFAPYKPSVFFSLVVGRVLSRHHSLKNKANEWEISRGGGTKNGSS